MIARARVAIIARPWLLPAGIAAFICAGLVFGWEAVLTWLASMAEEWPES